MMTDPIADMLTRLRNANTAFHDEVLMPSSKQKEALAKILVSEGYIVGFGVGDDAARPGPRADRRPPRRAPPRAAAVGDAPPPVPRVLGGMGIAILSTNQGLMTDRDA